MENQCSSFPHTLHISAMLTGKFIIFGMLVIHCCSVYAFSFSFDKLFLTRKKASDGVRSTSEKAIHQASDIIEASYTVSTEKDSSSEHKETCNINSEEGDVHDVQEKSTSIGEASKQKGWKMHGGNGNVGIRSIKSYFEEILQRLDGEHKRVIRALRKSEDGGEVDDEAFLKALNVILKDVTVLLMYFKNIHKQESSQTTFQQIVQQELEKGTEDVISKTLSMSSIEKLHPKSDEIDLWLKFRRGEENISSYVGDGKVDQVITNILVEMKNCLQTLDKRLAMVIAFEKGENWNKMNRDFKVLVRHTRRFLKKRRNNLGHHIEMFMEQIIRATKLPSDSNNEVHGHEALFPHSMIEKIRSYLNWKKDEDAFIKTILDTFVHDGAFMNLEDIRFTVLKAGLKNRQGISELQLPFHSFIFYIFGILAGIAFVLLRRQGHLNNCFAFRVRNRSGRTRPKLVMSEASENVARSTCSVMATSDDTVKVSKSSRQCPMPKVSGNRKAHQSQKERPDGNSMQSRSGKVESIKEIRSERGKLRGEPVIQTSQPKMSKTVRKEGKRNDEEIQSPEGSSRIDLLAKPKSARRRSRRLKGLSAQIE